MHIIRCGSREFAPTKIICVGRNFAAHAREMGGVPPSAEPVLFLKPNSAIARDPGEVVISASLGVLHHEVELCALAGFAGKNFTEDAAAELIAGYAVGIDFTLRERQTAAKNAGEPWALAKGFDCSAVFGAFLPAAEVLDPLGLELTLSVDGACRQRGNTREMLFTPARILAFVSRFMTIEAGDILMCGTPAGVDEVRDGDLLEAQITGFPGLRFVVRRS
jgi:2-keto-4-pentenoate hydratase/2-oxohepta-3-ene-1,7-dioic acid hydratase in catechol pathway